MKYKVIAECIDRRDGKRYFPGDTFPDPTEKQAERLVRVGCLEVEAGGKAASGSGKTKADADQADDLDGKGVLQLKAVAKKETIDIAGVTKKADLIAAIRKARQAKNG